MAKYIEVQDVLNKLVGVDTSKIADLSTKIDSIFIPAAQAQVATFLGYNPLEQEQERYYNGNGQQYLPLGICPVQSIRSCTIYTVPYTNVWINFQNISKKNIYDQFGNAITTPSDPNNHTDLVLDCQQGIIEIPETTDQVLSEFMPQFPCFLEGLANIKIVFTSGYSIAAMPQQIKDATAYFAAILALGSLGDNASKGLASISIGQMSRSFGNRVFQARIQEYNELTVILLNPFKLYFVL